VDLVVDASGRGSKVLDWLSEKGFARPDETVVDPLAGCSSRWFQAPPGHRLPGRQWWRGGLIRFARSDRNKVAVLFPVEGDRWIANLTGYGGHFLPSDERSFMAALSNLPSPFIAEAVAHGKPISGVFSHRGTANRMYHYDHWTERLDGFIAIGDAACVFNPVYGQGMSSAAVCATILGQEMRLYGPHSVDLPRHFFKAQAEWLALPWALATRADLGFPTTLGRRPSSGKILEWYMKEAVLTANEDARVRALYNQILTLVTPVSALFSPPIAARVLWSRVLRRLDGATGDPPPSRMPPGPPSLPR
jgi:2-polyprenyl-6-methoxyphenol hydroxylase-like FAD-dependent oxidoreductase